MAEFEPGRWYRINMPNGKLWMETSDPKEVAREAKKTGWPVERLWQRVTTEYDWRPTDTEGGATHGRAVPDHGRTR